MMGEAKRRRDRIDEATTAIGRALADQGKLIEAGWAIFADAVLPPDAPQVQRNDMQLAFMAGAEHLFSTTIDIIDEGDEVTETDLRRMEKIHEEIDQWRARLGERIQPSPTPPADAGEAWEASGRRLGDAPIEQQYHADMTAIAQYLDFRFNGQVGGPGRQTGFVLMVFPFGEVAPGGHGRCNYISNGADRKDIIVLMKEMIRRFEGQADPGEGRA